MRAMRPMGSPDSEFTGAPSGFIGPIPPIARIAPSCFHVSAVFQKSKEKPAWRIAGRVNEVNGVSEVSSWGRPPLSDGSTKWPRPGGVLDKVDKVDKVDPETWTRLTLLTLLTPPGRGILRTNETQHQASSPQFWDITNLFYLVWRSWRPWRLKIFWAGVTIWSRLPLLG